MIQLKVFWAIIQMEKIICIIATATHVILETLRTLKMIKCDIFKNDYVCM